MSNIKEEPGSAQPEAHKTREQRKNVRELNTRFQMLVDKYRHFSRENTVLKEKNMRQEMEFKKKLAEKEVKYTEKMEKLRLENENLIYSNKCVNQELNSSISAKKDFEERLLSSESRNAALSSENDTLKQEIVRNKEELNCIRNEYAQLKYQHSNYSSERKSLLDDINSYKIKNEQILAELNQKEANLKNNIQTNKQLLNEKNNEISSYLLEIKKLEKYHESTSCRLRKEFDSKLAEYVEKREEQYKQEKNEWMRIFKEEFNRKLRTFKESNFNLTEINKKLESEIIDLRTRISKLKQQKTELEIINRNNDEEIDKIRNDLDELQKTKNNEIHIKNGIICELRDKFKSKELEYDELCGLKLQLDSEIELYRNILNDAEVCAGYTSPFRSTSNNNKKRKRVKHNMDHAESSKLNQKNKIVTPGIARAAVNAKNDVLKSLKPEEEDENEDDDMYDAEQKDEEESYVTAGCGSQDIEGAELQFSSLDLLRGMVEIQNMGENNIKLNGYTLSNQDGSAQYFLPNDLKLDSKETLRIYIGEKLMSMMGNDDDCNHAEIINQYKGNYVFWPKDVWTGSNIDCARLYNPNNDEIARIQISPDMLPKNASNNKGCFIM